MDLPPNDAWEPSEPLDEVSLVRPYMLTAGRTESRVSLPLEAPIRTLRFAPAPRFSDSARRVPPSRRSRLAYPCRSVLRAC
jgi:hypothetical protein